MIATPEQIVLFGGFENGGNQVMKTTNGLLAMILSLVLILCNLPTIFSEETVKQTFKLLRDFETTDTCADVTDSSAYITAGTEMNKLIANCKNDVPSNIYEIEEYYVYIAPAHSVSGYTVEVVHKSEHNKLINKSDYKELEHSAMASELNKGVNCYITATPYEIILDYPNIYIKVKDSQGNPYYITGTYNNVLNNIEKGKQ